MILDLLSTFFCTIDLRLKSPFAFIHKNERVLNTFGPILTPNVLSNCTTLLNENILRASSQDSSF